MIVVKHVDSVFGSLLPIRLSTFKLVVHILMLRPRFKKHIPCSCLTLVRLRVNTKPGISEDRRHKAEELHV